MLHQILDSAIDNIDIVSKETDSAIARRAEQVANLAGGVIMIDLCLPATSKITEADGASVVLRGQHLFEIGQRHAVTSGRDGLEPWPHGSDVGVLLGDSFACFAQVVKSVTHGFGFPKFRNGLSLFTSRAILRLRRWDLFGQTANHAGSIFSDPGPIAGFAVCKEPIFIVGALSKVFNWKGKLATCTDFGCRHEMSITQTGS
jgi:hypothetical protein